MKNQANNLHITNSTIGSIFLKRILLLAFAFIFTIGLAHAGDQNKEGDAITMKIKGKVTTDEGTIPGVNVYLKGTQTGTLTDKNGEFTFPKEVQVGDILIFSFLGYETVEYSIAENTPEFITIKLNQKSLVITGALASDAQPGGINKLFAKIKSIF